MAKIPSGGWVALLISFLFSFVMLIWYGGEYRLRRFRKVHDTSTRLELLQDRFIFPDDGQAGEHRHQPHLDQTEPSRMSINTNRSEYQESIKMKLQEKENEHLNERREMRRKEKQERKDRKKGKKEEKRNKKFKLSKKSKKGEEYENQEDVPVSSDNEAEMVEPIHKKSEPSEKKSEGKKSEEHKSEEQKPERKKSKEPRLEQKKSKEPRSERKKSEEQKSEEQKPKRKKIRRT